MKRPPGKNSFAKYNLYWTNFTDDLTIEMEMIRHGGRWKKKNGEMAGEGTEFHFRKLMEILWPWDEESKTGIKWHSWAEIQMRCYLAYRIIGQLGSASSGKSFVPAACVLADYYCYPNCTTVLVSSTTRESLEMRVWGEIKKLHRMARAKFELPGYLIEGKQRIVSDPRDEAVDGRDFRNGLVGVACKRGQTFQGIEEYVGIKNKRLRLLADELQFMPKQFIGAISNMNKNTDFKCVGSGNPKDTMDALGVLCEPAAHLGGWDGGIDQTPKSKTWEIRFPKGICIQFCGTDSPNLNGLMGIPLITQEQIDTDISFYGKDSIQYTMMDMGMMPRGQGSRRVLTRNLCLKFGAMEEPIWLDSDQHRVGFLDAAYRGTGGDRCVFGELRWGKNSEGKSIIALIDTMVIPIKDAPGELPEDQIAIQVMDQCKKRNIPPNQMFFDSTGRGSLMSAFARLWSPQVVPIEFGGSASERIVANGIDVKCKDYYSKFVTELWYSVRLVIECRQFRGMTEDVMSEGCMREWTMTAGNKIEVEPKDKMKLKCFVAGTMIKTPIGEVPIEHVKPGDFVETPLGASRVAFIHCNLASDLYRVEFSNGSELTATGDHKIFTWNHGWVRLDKLSLHCILESVRLLPLWKLLTCLNGSSTKAASTGFKALVDTTQEIKSTARRRDFFTELSGKTDTDLFLTACACITRMVFGRITKSRILNWFRDLFTLDTTCACDGRTPSSERRQWDESKYGLTNQECGIVPQRAGSGIGSMAAITGQIESQLPIAALYAENRSRLFGAMPGSVQGTAMGSSERLTTEKIVGFVRSAASLIWGIITSLRRTVPSRVQRLQCGEPERVYNLTLENHNVYYANGILVSNCGRSPDLFDALVAGVEGARRMGFVIEKVSSRTDSREGNRWKTELRRQHSDAWRSHELSYGH